MKRRFVAVAMAAQVGVLAFMAGEREWIARTGEPIRLRTAPVDPMDPMRGAYVRLDYEISQVPRAQCSGDLPNWMEETEQYAAPPRRDALVYASLRRNETGVAELVTLSNQRPAEGLFLRGRIDSISADRVHVRYGVEALFMEQGRALSFESEAREEKAGVPVNTFLAVSPRGVGVLTGYEWEPLGLTIVLRQSVPDASRRGPDGVADRPRLRGLTAELKNHGSEPLAIVDRPNFGSWRLLEDQRRPAGAYRWAGETESVPPASPADVIVLAPGAVHRVEIDLSDARWSLLDSTGQRTSLPQLEDGWNAWFRLEYRAPDAASAERLPQAERIRLGSLRSRSFSPMGAID